MTPMREDALEIVSHSTWQPSTGHDYPSLEHSPECRTCEALDRLRALVEAVERDADQHARANPYRPCGCGTCIALRAVKGEQE